METTRHVTATVYVVNDGATALHEHKRHAIHIPPGGHVDRDELPHEAGLREVKEEMGVAASLLGTTADIQGSGVEALPQPRHTLLYDINVHDGSVGHQHVDLIYYATVPSHDIDPAPDEAAAEAWGWFTKSDLRADSIDPEVEQLGIEAIEMARE